MAPFGLSRAFSKSDKNKTGASGSHVTSKHEDGSYVTTSAPPSNIGWKRVLKRKKPAPPLPGQAQPLPMDQGYMLEQEQHSGGMPMYAHDPRYSRTPGPGHVPLLDESPPGRHASLKGKGKTHTRSSSSSSSASSSSSGRRHHAPSILPRDSASNVHINRHPSDGHRHGHPRHPMMGIVEEQSDIEYITPEYVHPESPVITPIRTAPGQPIVIGPTGHLAGVPQHQYREQMLNYPTHTGGSHVTMPVPMPHTRQGHHPPLPQSSLRPVKIMDAQGNQQDVQEIILDGSGVQEIPMPAHGNVIFIVDAGTKLDVKDPETGEYIPLDQYYANLARRPPPRQDVQVTVTGDASNLIIEDSDGRIIHRGAGVHVVPGSPSSSHGPSYIHEHPTGSHHSHYHGHHHDDRHDQKKNSYGYGDVRVFYIETPPPPQPQYQFYVNGKRVEPELRKYASDRSSGSDTSAGTGSSRSSRSRRSNVTYSDRDVQVLHVDTTPEVSMLGSAKHAHSARGSPSGHEDDGRDISRPVHLPVIKEERWDNRSKHSRSPSVSSRHPNGGYGGSASPLPAPAPLHTDAHSLLGHGGPISPVAPMPSPNSLGYANQAGYFPSSARSTARPLPGSQHGTPHPGHESFSGPVVEGGVVMNVYPPEPSDNNSALDGPRGQSPHYSNLAGTPRSILQSHRHGVSPSPSLRHSPKPSIAYSATGQEGVPGGYPSPVVALHRTGSGASRRTMKSTKSGAPSFHSARSAHEPVPPLPTLHESVPMPSPFARDHPFRHDGSSPPPVEIQSLDGQAQFIAYGGAPEEHPSFAQGWSPSQGGREVVATMRPNSTFSLATLGEGNGFAQTPGSAKSKKRSKHQTPSMPKTSPSRSVFGMSGPPLVGSSLHEQPGDQRSGSNSPPYDPQHPSPHGTEQVISLDSPAHRSIGLHNSHSPSPSSAHFPHDHHQSHSPSSFHHHNALIQHRTGDQSPPHMPGDLASASFLISDHPSRSNSPAARSANYAPASPPKSLNQEMSPHSFAHRPTSGATVPDFPTFPSNAPSLRQPSLNPPSPHGSKAPSHRSIPAPSPGRSFMQPPASPNQHRTSPLPTVVADIVSNLSITNHPHDGSESIKFEGLGVSGVDTAGASPLSFMTGGRPTFGLSTLGEEDERKDANQDESVDPSQDPSISPDVGKKAKKVDKKESAVKPTPKVGAKKGKKGK